MDAFFEALPSMLSAITLAVLGWVISKGKQVIQDLNQFKKEHEELLTIKEDYKDFRESQQEQLDKYKEESRKALREYSEEHHKEFLAYQESVSEVITELRKKQAIFNDSQRTQLKAQIVEIYQTSKDRGYITPMDLDIVNKLGANYFDLDGNTYIDAILKRCNEQIEIRGEGIPS